MNSWGKLEQVSHKKDKPNKLIVKVIFFGHMPFFNWPLYLNFIIYCSGTAENINESIQKDDLEKERSINRELQARLMEKENQLKISEKQNEKLKRHMMTTNTLVKIQQEQIKRLKLELSQKTRNGCEPQPHLSSTGTGYNSVSTTDPSSHGLTNRIDSSSHGLSLTNRMVTNSPPGNVWTTTNKVSKLSELYLIMIGSFCRKSVILTHF